VRQLEVDAVMVEYDPFSNEVIHGDNYAIYKALRDEAPVYYSEKWDCYVLSRFEGVWAACQSPAISSASGSTTAHLLTKVQPVLPMLNTMDPPSHSGLRALLRKQFMPRRVKQLEPRIEAVVEELLDNLRELDAPDFVADFAQPLATTVGCMVIGLPVEDGVYLRGLVDQFFSRDPDNPGMTERGLAAMVEMNDYFGDLSAERRGKPAADFDAISVLQSWEGRDGQRADDHEVASNLQLLLIGGTDTLPKVLASFVLRLAQNPDQRADLAADPSLAPDAFNEAVRIDMPTQNMARKSIDDFEVHGETIPAGKPVLLLYTAANRDEREFPNPDVYDIRRRAPRSLSFSHGTHACIGLHVARKEGECAINELLRRYPRYVIDEAKLERYATEFVQGYSRVPIALGDR
jgi:cytochrome P450